MKLCHVFLQAALAGLLARPSPIAAQPDSIGRHPYDLRLVFLLSDHRFLTTELFQDQFPRELAQQTKAALGPLARVEVARSHPLAEAIRRDGLDAAVDAHEEVSQQRTWFFTVAFRDGQFHLQGRFFDGLTGLPGPPTRTAVTSDRGRLAFLAATMIAEPFLVVGTVMTEVKGDHVNLSIHGGQIGEGPAVRPGAVFAVSQIAVESGKRRARRLPWAVLEAQSSTAGGIVACRFWRRYDENIAPTEKVVYRALLLPTRSAPLKLQVIDRDTSQPLAGFGVKIAGGVRRDIELVTDVAGMVATTEKIDRLARVTLSMSGTALVQFPAPIIDDRVLVCAISTQPDAENLTRLDIRRQQLIVRILDTLQVVYQRFSELEVLLGQSYEESLPYAKRTLAFLDSEIAYIRDEREEIKQLDAKRKSAPSALDDADKGLKRLKELRADVGDFIARITQSIAERDRQTEKQNKAAKLVEQAALLESQAQFDEAIEVYQAAVQLVPNEPKVAKRLESLRADWALKDNPHKQARKFMLETWPKVDVQVIKEHLAGAQKSLDVCRDAGDRLTPRRFLMSTGEHLSKISRIVETLKQSQSTDDRQRLKAWQETVETLRRLTNQAIEQIEPSAAEKK